MSIRNAVREESIISHRKIAGIAAAAITLLLINVAKADDMSVKYRSAELESDNGTTMVYKRIQRAARSFCVTPGLRPLELKRAERACYEAMLNKAILEADEPRLSSLHSEKQELIRIVNR